MRIGTWNLAGRWDGRHEALLHRRSCDVWLLTEVDDRLEIPGFADTRTSAYMAPGRRWAGVFAAGELEELPAPHPATAAARVDGTTYWSTILPWRSCGGKPPWSGSNHAERTRNAVSDLLSSGDSPPIVWGGDWNHALAGREHAGSMAGRQAIEHATDVLGLSVPTGHLDHRVAGALSIDHIAVPRTWSVTDAVRIVAEHDGKRLSDHDMYVVEVVRTG